MLPASLAADMPPSSEGHCVYYGVAGDRDVRETGRNGLLPRLRRITVEELARRGYPQSGIRTLGVRPVSQEEIDAAGSFNDFRQRDRTPPHGRSRVSGPVPRGGLQSGTGPSPHR